MRTAAYRAKVPLKNKNESIRLVHYIASILDPIMSTLGEKQMEIYAVH